MLECVRNRMLVEHTHALSDWLTKLTEFTANEWRPCAIHYEAQLVSINGVRGSSDSNGTTTNLSAEAKSI